jgi:hypothetical protein
MKSTCQLLLSILIFCSCNSNGSKDIVLNSDSLKYAPIEEKRLIVPGKSIGRFSIGQNVVAVDSILGTPDSSDAAMGKAWNIWYGRNSTSGKRNEIAIYSTYADSSMKWKAVKQIRVISGKFQTIEGLNNGNLLSSFEAKYPDFKKIATYFDAKLSDTIYLYDSKENGIAVEFLRDISRAITIHHKGEQVNESYYTLAKNLRKLN